MSILAMALAKDLFFTDEVWPHAPDGVKTCWRWSKDKLKNENITLIAEKSGSEWRIFRKDYLPCQDGEINETFVKELAQREPLRVVFRDAGFAGDDIKINVEQIFKPRSPHTEVKTL